MTPTMFPGYVTCLLLATVVFPSVHSTAVNSSSSLHFKSVKVGQDVTLKCFHQGQAMVFFWYKQAFGQKPKLISKYFKYERNGTLSNEFKNDPRIELETSSNKNHLKISNVQMSDSAIYYCVSGHSYVHNYLEGFSLQVKGSASYIQASVHQSSSEIIQPGGSVTLNCTVQTEICDGEHSVYWFQDSEDSHPALIYTHGGRNDQCERNPNTQTHTCVYNLLMKDLNVSHAGTYYCAVASCGHILFGNGTKLYFKDKMDIPVLLGVLIGTLVFSIFLVVYLSYKTYTMHKEKSCKEPPERSSAVSEPNAEGHRDADNLHYAALKEMNVSRSRRQRDNTGKECVYSSVKQQ